MQFSKYHLPVMLQALSHHVQNKQWEVDYYRTLPGYMAYDLKQHHGYSREDKLREAREAAEEAKEDLKYHFKTWADGQLSCSIEEADICRALKDVIRENLREAASFKAVQFAPVLIISRYKKAVIALDALRQIRPEYKEVTARYFLNKN